MEENTTQRSERISILLNLLIVVFEVIGFYHAIAENKFEIFLYYTFDSNLLVLFTSFLYLIPSLRRSKYLPLIKYFVIILVSVTVVIVFLVLVPMVIPDGKDEVMRLLWGDANRYHHIVCPALAIISYIVFERKIKITKAYLLLSLLPTVVYGVILLIMNFARITRGPYPFLYVYEKSAIEILLWMSAVVLLVFGVSVLYKFITNKRAANND